MAQQYCKNGHDTFAVGRVQRMCRECRRASDRRRYAASPRRRAQVVNSNALQRLRARMAAKRRQILELLLGRENPA